MLAVPRTYRFEPGGGFEMIPIDTPFWYATFPSMLVHWVGMMAMFAACVMSPY